MEADNTAENREEGETVWMGVTLKNENNVKTKSINQ